jgi:hydroxymethylbilane synthase
MLTPSSTYSDTRLNKLDAEDGPYDALILASAGLIRSGQSDRISAFLQSPIMLHAVGQGAIGIEIRSQDSRMKKMVSTLNHLETDWRTSCERSMLHELEGGCSVPVGVETQFLPPARGKETDQAKYLGERPLALRAIIASLDGTRVIEHEVSRQIYSKAEAVSLGCEMAQWLIQKGGRAILEELGRIVEQKNVKGVNDSVATHQKEQMDVDQSGSQIHIQSQP